MLETLKGTKEWMDMGYVKDIKDIKIEKTYLSGKKLYDVNM